MRLRSLLSPLLQRISFLQSRGFRQAIAYIFAVVVMYMFTIFVDRYMVKWDTVWHLVGFAALLLLLGIMNVVLLRRPFYDNVVDWQKSLLTLGANLLGVALFIKFSSYSSLDAYAMLFLPALLFFSIPWFFLYAVQAMLDIPKLEYDSMEIRSLQDIIAEVDWAEDEGRGIVWEFEDLDEMETKEYRVRTHTPHAINALNLGELFKCLLSLHNHNLSPGRPVFFEEGEDFYGWRFFHERDFLLWKKRRPLNPLKNLRQNTVFFHLLSKREREEIKDLRKGLTKKFKRTKIIIARNSQSEIIIE